MGKYLRKLLEYQGYVGEFGLGDDTIFVGHVLGMKRNIITFKGETAVELNNSFQGAVDGYLAECSQEKSKPERPFKGSFNVRIGTARHTALAKEASRKNTSINNLIVLAIDQIYVS